MSKLTVLSIIEHLRDAKSDFEAVALTVFKHQFQHNAVYRQYCTLLNKSLENVTHLNDIPFLPIQFFKSHKVQCFDTEPDIIFSSSGTGGTQSLHAVKHRKDYEAAFFNCWTHFFGAPSDYVFLPLLPSYAEREGSSLIYMVDKLMEASGQQYKTYFLNQYQSLHEHYQKAIADKKKVVLFAVTFALLDLCDRNLDFSQATIMETGGMKGRGKELVREELHQRIANGLNRPKIYSEYGMTELLSQAYALDGRLFNCPPWMRIMLRQSDDPFSMDVQKQSGGINLIDLSNLHSCSFIESQDLGKMHPFGIEVLGRFDHSELRGCNLLISE